MHPPDQRVILNICSSFSLAALIPVKIIKSPVIIHEERRGCNWTDLALMVFISDGVKMRTPVQYAISQIMRR